MLPFAPTAWILAHTETGKRTARAIAKHFQATLHGLEHLPPPKQGALLVGNHAYLGLDSIALSACLLSEANLLPRFLAEKNLYRIPGLSPVLHTVGAIPGVAEDAIELLKANQVVAVYPGGINDSFKLTTDAYSLQWKDRKGFARVAMRAQKPIIPIAATGVDELYQIDKREPFLGRLFGGSEKYDIPLPSSLRPKRIPLDFYVLPPIQTEGDPDRPEDVERVRSETEQALRSVLEPYRKSRGL